MNFAYNPAPCNTQNATKLILCCLHSNTITVHTVHSVHLHNCFVSIHKAYVYYIQFQQVPIFSFLLLNNEAVARICRGSFITSKHIVHCTGTE